MYPISPPWCGKQAGTFASAEWQQPSVQVAIRWLSCPSSTLSSERSVLLRRFKDLHAAAWLAAGAPPGTCCIAELAIAAMMAQVSLVNDAGSPAPETRAFRVWQCISTCAGGATGSNLGHSRVI